MKGFIIILGSLVAIGIFATGVIAGLRWVFRRHDEQQASQEHERFAEDLADAGYRPGETPQPPTQPTGG